MKKLYVFAMLLVVVAMLVSAYAPQELSQLRIRNKIVGETVGIKMMGIRYGVGYWLQAPGPTHWTRAMIGTVANAGPAAGLPTSFTVGGWIRNSTFDIRKDIYDITIYLCGLERSGTLNMVVDNRLIFPSCYGSNANSGEPGKEKVDLFNAQPGVCNAGLDSDPGDGAEPWGCWDTVAGDGIHWRLDWFNWWNGQGDWYEEFWP